MNDNETIRFDDLDRAIINNLQGGFPLVEEPFDELGQRFGIEGPEVLGRISRMLDDGVLSRFGPMYHAEKMGGGLTLAAMKVPVAEFDRIADIVNGFDEVAHNYERDHAFNMWFVVATETPERIAEVIAEIEAATGLSVANMPKIDEFFIGLKFEV
ncbi:MAG: Lrp/AsnC family transcriptional regulator [Rhodospirillaceae bacterium]|jgi:siroheme decarboxylase|nr:Lrp/AsnC family transcriptional regulator [Rhodospirillaceae bacterium]MBT4219546.1 Lrp/AsnC family transcriptional regulator [Rhodospirillaceae bacterium]MBT5014699.1 Lrp/AsnC family transcriptional regulator [Rhodospirillaceae bacterium]MBT5308876.1 Lrp/AsnC family transcriptional regulator [Rhodospirillaceae bacterium]MBT6407580.1 Lrp/AsnC family transcriptional regulator [Rhodospirillaceae bacterium]